MRLFVSARHRTSEKGFSLAEVGAAAAILAIMSLLVIVLVRERVQEARLTACQDDLVSLMKAETLAYADTNQFFRLQDLDNTAEPNAHPAVALPQAYWNMPFQGAAGNTLRKTLESRWKGPYTAVPGNTTLNDILNIDGRTEFFWGVAGAGGPILLIQPDTSAATEPYSDKIPVDPWGNPYIFFGPGKITDELGSVSVSQPPLDPPNGPETDFGNSVIYSMGPDGFPGSRVNFNAADLRREAGWLGGQGTDDLKITF